MFTVSVKVGSKPMEITGNTRVSEILEKYGDIADVMEVFGVKRVGRYSFRRMLTKALTVKTAARVHRVPLDEFLSILRQAVSREGLER
jgi:hypothetical protein